MLCKLSWCITHVCNWSSVKKKMLIYCLECLFNPARASWIKCSNLQPEPKRSSGCRTSFTHVKQSKAKWTFCCYFQSAIASEGRTEWGIDALLCEFTWETNLKKEKKRKKMGELWGKCVFDYTDKPFLHFMLFFPFGERGLCWTLNSDSARNPWALQSAFVFFKSFSHGSERANVSLSVCAFIRITESHKHPHSMDRNGLKFRAMQGPYRVLFWDVHTMWRSEVIFFFVKFYILSLL